MWVGETFWKVKRETLVPPLCVQSLACKGAALHEPQPATSRDKEDQPERPGMRKGQPG